MAKGLPEDPARGERLRKLRGHRSLDAIAAGARIGARSLTNWEKGAPITWAKLEALASYYGVSADWIATGESNEEAPASRIEQLEQRLKEVEEMLARITGAAGPTEDDHDALSNPDDLGQEYWGEGEGDNAAAGGQP